MSLGLEDDIYYVADDTYSVGTLEIAPDEYENGEIIVRAAIGFVVDGSWTWYPNTGGVYDNINSVTATNNFDVTAQISDPDYWMGKYTLLVTSSGNDIVIADKGQNFDFTATNLQNALTVIDSSGKVLMNTNWHANNITGVRVGFTDRVGIYHVAYYDYVATQNNDVFNLSFSVPAPCDAYSVHVEILFDHVPMYAGGVEQYYQQSGISYYASYGFRNSMFIIGNTASDNSGFFASIIEWLQNIRDRIQSVAQSVANLGSTMTNVWNSIKNLPSQIWTYISDGLTSLFIPDEETITGIKEDWDGLMSDRFGAIYDAGSLITDWAGNFQEQSAKDTIQMPSVTVNLAGTPFTFGGYDVKLIPDGFGALVEILKGLLDIVCTLAFVNAMRKRYDSIVGGG